MRKLIVLLVVCCAAHAHGDLLLYDGFNPQTPDSGGTYNYRPGELLAAFPDPNGGNPNGQFNVDYNRYWRRASDVVAGPPQSEAANIKTPGITSGSLSIPGLQASVGNSVAYDLTKSPGIARIDLPSAITSGTVYWSGVLLVGSVPNLDPATTAAGGGIIIGGFNGSTGAATSTPTVFAGLLAITKNSANTSQYFLGTSVNNTSRIFDVNSPQSGGVPVFVVGSYTKNPGGTDDTVSLWVNPDMSSFGAAAAPATLVTAGLAASTTESALASYILRNVSDTTGPDPTIQFDELRIGTTWADVTPPSAVPEASGALFLLVGSVLLAGRSQAVKPLLNWFNATSKNQPS